MTVASLSPLLVQKFFDNNGAILSNGTLSTFSAGTSTPVATYTDSTGVTPNTNPIVLNARGEANVWVLPNVAYKFLLKDSLGNTIYTVDNVVNSQLITLYGGVDTGTPNAYILNFVAPFTSYVDGTYIIWIPANTNTGSSTININGLGVINLTNQDGSALNANQIIGGSVTTILIKGGAALLVSSGVAPAITQGTTTLTLGGVVGTVTTVASYTIVGDVVTLRIPKISGTSNSVSFSAATGNASPIAPTAGATSYISMPAMQDNGASIYAQIGSVALGTFGKASFSFSKNGVSTGWTATGTKGIGEAAVSQGTTIVYKIA